MVKGHAPIVLVVGGFLTLFISLHTAAFAVAIAAGLHVVLGALVLAVGWMRRRSSGVVGDRDGVQR